MKIVELKELEFNTTNIPSDTTALWDIDSGYALDTIRKVDKKLYQSLGIIDPLCEYIYNNTDPLNTHYTTIANTTLAVADNTLVACTQTTTIVYVVDTNIYYQYTAVSTNVDFTNTDFATSPSFSSVTDYRHDIFEPSVTPLKWEDLGFTNKYKLIDNSLSSQTVVTGSMEMSFLTTKIDSIYFFNLFGESVSIKVTQVSSATVLYDETISLIDKNSGGTHWGYYFNDFTFKTRLNINTPLNFNLLVEITINNLNGESKCGMVGMGRSEEIGMTLYGSGVGMIDFSKKEVNTNGETFLSVGNFKDTNSLTVDILSGRSDIVINRLRELRAKPVVYEGSDFASMIIYGIYNDWDTVFNTPALTRLNINLESLT